MNINLLLFGASTPFGRSFADLSLGSIRDLLLCAKHLFVRLVSIAEVHAIVARAQLAQDETIGRGNCLHGSDEQMFGAEEQVRPHEQSDKRQRDSGTGHPGTSILPVPLSYSSLVRR